MSCNCWNKSDMEYKSRIKTHCDQIVLDFKLAKKFGSDVRLEDIIAYIEDQVITYYVANRTHLMSKENNAPKS